MATSTSQAAPTSAVPVTQFLDSLGVNVHTTYNNTVYANTSLVEEDLAYLGIKNVRDGVNAIGAYNSVGQEQLAATGYKFDFVMETPTASAIAALNYYATNDPGSILSVEGPNEVGFGPVTFNGGTSVADEIADQQAIYNAVHSDPYLKGVNVINLTLGLQSSISYSQLGNMTSAADEGNAHVYAPYGFSPSYDFSGILSLEGAPTSGLPMVITEAGYATDPSYISGVDDTVQAKYTLDLLMDAAKAGVAQIYLYELLDEFSDPTGANNQDHYGLFNNDGTPKLAATAIHNLTTILSDPTGSTSFQTGTLAYTVAGLPSSGSQILFEKSNGVYDIALWAEPNIWNSTSQQEITAPTETVTVAFGHVEQEVLVFDPLLGTAPIASYTNVSQVQVGITDHPLIVEVENPGGSAGVVQAAPTIVSYSSGNSPVGSGLSNLKQITLAGDAPADSTVTIFDGTTALGSVSALGNGTWSFTTGVLADGTHSFTAIDSSGDPILSGFSKAMVVTTETVAPTAPTILSFSPDTAIAGGAFTSADILTLTGKAEADTTVKIYDGTKLLGTVGTDASGDWSYTTGKLADSVQDFTATDTDAFGNVSTASSTFAVTVETQAPAAPSIVSFSPETGHTGSGITDADVLTLSGKGVTNTIIDVFDGKTMLGTATVNSAGAWSFKTGTLADGAHSFTATDTDAAGLASKASSALSVDIDTTVPTPTLTGLVHNADGSWTVTGTSEPGSTDYLYLNGGTTKAAIAETAAGGTWSATLTLPNNEVYTITAGSTNAADNYAAGTNAAIIGSGGNNTLVGSPGDFLAGNGGKDTFVFEPNFGKETIIDFSPTQNTIEFSHNTFANFAAVMADAAQVGANTVITEDASHVLTLSHTNVSSLHASNFLFV